MTPVSSASDGSSSRVGVSGIADRIAVVNIADLARQEALEPAARKERIAPPLMAIPHNLPVSEMPKGTDRPEVDAVPGDSDRESSVTTEALPGPLIPSPISMASLAAVAYNGWIPPDAGGAIGPYHFVSIHNGTMRIHDKLGGIVSTVTLDAFWASVAGPGWPPSLGYTFDPKILYDYESGRWIVTACDDMRAFTSGILIGVSQRNDPTGNWNLYKVWAHSGGVWAGRWADYPSIGFNDRWIVVQANMFRGDNFDSSFIYVFNKADLLVGGVGQYSLFFLDNMGATQVPAIGSSSTGAMYLLQNWNGNDNGYGYLRLYTITGAVGSEVLTPGSFVRTPSTWDSVSPAGFGNFGPQFNSAARIHLGDSRIRNNVVCRAGIESDYLYAVHTVFLPAGGGSNRSAVQFWEVRTDGSVGQFGRIDDPTGMTFYAYPSVAVTVLHSVLIGFSSFSASQYPSGNWAFRWGSDPPGVLQMGGVLKSGEGPYENNDNGGRNRWGDYSSTCLDPDTSNGSMIWTLQEYSLPPEGAGDGSGRWGTWWGKFAFSEIG